ncbi:hypothetical protein BHG07_01330 [Brenneria salicis ATCC 15712 = DSM 30166]|nr:hypothetical protein BHG07_01330 [Brenneria salicis ATCC 15712 = DSM 30166]
MLFNLLKTLTKDFVPIKGYRDNQHQRWQEIDDRKSLIWAIRNPTATIMMPPQAEKSPMVITVMNGMICL